MNWFCIYLFKITECFFLPSQKPLKLAQYIFKYHYFITNSLSPRIVSSIGLGCMNWQITPSFIPPLLLLTPRSLILQANNIAGLETRLAISMSHYTLGMGGQLSPSPSPFLWQSWDVWGRRLTPQLRALTAPRGARRQRVLQQRSLHWPHLSISLRFTLRILHAFQRSLSAIQNAKWEHRGLSAKEKASYRAMRRNT